ncbi:MAG: hypothetical protein R6U64_02790 [Bacteroidales bacterium]
MKATEGYIVYLNKHAPSNTGIFNLVKFAGKADMVFLNWIENLPEKKAGWLQTVFFLIFLRIRKWVGIKVVWTLHNKISHSARQRYLKEILFNNLLKYSDLIITHSHEGVRFASEKYPQASSRLFFFPHPVTPANGNQQPEKKEYDILIWGTMAPYKGIDTFLEYLEQQDALSRYRILIAGKAGTPEFFQKINQYSSPVITIKNQFIDPGELSQMIARSTIVLFTYSGASVLSSGALMDSISNRAYVVGPHVGAFAEMADLGIIQTYHDFNELQTILDASKSNFPIVTAREVEKFIREHTWPEFGKALQHRVIGLLEYVKDQKGRFRRGTSSAPRLMPEKSNH